LSLRRRVAHVTGRKEKGGQEGGAEEEEEKDLAKSGSLAVV